MPARRIEAGPLLVLVGAAVLLVSLFLTWYAPGLTAWDVFELLDLVLAALAIGAGLAAVAQLGALGSGPDPRALPWLCGAALILVLATVIDAPPAVAAADTESGLWIALVGAVLMALGAVLVGARVRISFDVEARRRRVSAVESRRTREEPAAAGSSEERRPWDESDGDDTDLDAPDDAPGSTRVREDDPERT